MPKERENMFAPLHFVDYDIAGNSVRAYYDFNNRLIFVLDSTTNTYKPNVLLVIAQDSDRKWDDILANDYGVDLETVRPKKNNRYQKLDIEYDGLDIYDELIRGYNDGTGLDTVLARLENYRADAAQNAATERLAAAEDTAVKSRETIAKAKDSIDEIQARIKRLRAQLAQYKSKIGKEPTKQSAAKILRTESQIEMAGVKLSRAKRRLDKAQKRLAAAEEEADAARDMLDKLARRIPVDVPVEHELPAVVDMRATELVVPVENNTELTVVDTASDDDEVQPLLSQDPEILDEEIAFKPIDFDTVSTVPAPVPDETPRKDDRPIVAPLAFTPPVANLPAEEITEIEEVDLAPVLDTIKSVSAPDEDVTVITEEQTTPINVTPVASDASVPGVVPAPVSSEFRPVSPTVPVTPVGGGVTATRGPTVLYYVMLVALVVLSIFTLWMYQRSTADNVPDLATTGVVESDAELPGDDLASPFIETDDAAPVVVQDTVVTETVVAEPEPQPEPEPEPEPVPPVQLPEPEPEPTPVAAEPEPEPEPLPVVSVEFAAPDVVSAPEPEPEPEPVVASEAEVVMAKPAYNVSQQENMFVASDDYDTDVPTCEGGAMPDESGCCPGEVATDLGVGTIACCQEYGDECYPPMSVSR